MTQSLIEGVIDMLDFFPSKNAISDTMGPAMLIEGKHKLDFGKKRIEFGAYAMVYLGTHNNIKIVLKAPNKKEDISSCCYIQENGSTATFGKIYQ